MARNKDRKITATYTRGLAKELKSLLGPLDRLDIPEEVHEDPTANKRNMSRRLKKDYTGGGITPPTTFMDPDPAGEDTEVTLRNKSIGDRGALNKRANMRKYKKEVQGLWRNLHRQLYKVYGGFVVSPNDRGAHIKLWFNGDLRELNLACRKVANVAESLLELLEQKKEKEKG